MRLQKIVLDGFKSFADKTELVFDSKITGIVGPNGCGKSNVVDAVKWVLGEQSVKSLRSGHMADVIFSGSSSRKSLSTAEVSLYFSNTSGKLPIESDEVQISRRIYQSGDCEYKINGKICRLKDIRELFMDTGIGVKAYSIIEQGQVDRLLSASKEDRRSIFEEAAGVSKYKAHKKEALRKLERTEQNLLRLADILGEVQKQLRSVKVQAGKARNYLQHTQRLKELQVNYSLSEFDKINRANTEKLTDLSQVEEHFATVAAEVSKNDAILSEVGSKIIETENEINKTDNYLVSISGKIEQFSQRIDFLKARSNELLARKAETIKKIEKMQEEKKQYELNIGNYRQQFALCERELEIKQAEAETFQKELSVLNSDITNLEADLEDEKSGIIDIVRRTSQLHNELQTINVVRTNLSSQKDRLSNRADIAKAELEQLLADKAHHTARRNDIDKVLEELQSSFDAKRKKIEELNILVTSDSKKLSEAKENRSALNGELKILKDMEGRREGLNESVKQILQKKMGGSQFGYVEGILADIVAADAEYATAIEAALEGISDSVVVNSTRELLNDEIMQKPAARVKFISNETNELFYDANDLSQEQGVKGRAVEVVKSNEKFSQLIWRLLGKTLIVDSVHTAAELCGKYGNEYKYVTVNGEFMDSEGLIKMGPVGKSIGLISRKSRITQLEDIIEKISQTINDLQAQIEKNNQVVIHLDKVSKELRTAIYEANTEKMQLTSKVTIFEQNIKRLSEEQPLIVSEIKTLHEQITASVQKEYDSKQKLQELEIVNKERNAVIEELETEFGQKKEDYQALNNKLTDLKVSVGRNIEQNKALKQAISSIEIQMQSNISESQTAQSEIQNCSQQAQQADRDILGCEANICELYVEKEQVQNKSRELHRQIEELLEEQRQAEQLIRQKRAEQAEVEQRINQARIDIKELEVKQQGLIERIRDELQMDLVAAYQNYENQNIDWDSVRNEIAELRGKIERLGNVNVDSIAELEELEKRNEFLTTQLEDLNQSKAQLQQLINKLNEQSIEKFQQTFDQIRINFQELFRKLFGGGKADIFLENAEDILEAGIEIIAKPPGKETRSISLLSGGEKTMTAIALLFSVFKSKPSPFCMLDEVDAALDEANNERFNLLIKEFESQSQFIIITHSKRTMSIADELYGVTMQSRGVSKKISVKFNEYEPDKEQASVA